MPLLAGDIRFARSVNMADVPEGGGPPSALLLTSGRSNEIFPDISEETRTVGRVEIYQIFGLLRNTDRDPLLGANVIIAEPPADPNVSITMLSLKNPFATRAEIARRIESGMAAGSEWSGYLLENHFTTMRSIQLLQRPGTPPPSIGKTYVLVYQEGQNGERRQRVRIKSVDVQKRIYTQIVNDQMLDFEAQVSTCELFDGLAYDFPGSPPSRMFAREPNKTMVRETVYNDAGMFFSASRLTQATTLVDTWLQTSSIYTQIVPNSRTEAASVDQRPAARRTIVLAETPRRVEVGITPHTQRFKIAEENVGLTYVFQCQPLPEPGTLLIDYWALGQRYTIADDGEGKLTGQGGGAVSYLTGAVSVTLKAIPDIGSMITLSHGARTAYTNRSAQGAAVRPPEYSWVIESELGDAVAPGSLVITYTSAGQVRTVNDSAGKLQGDGTGVIDYPSRTVLLRPAFMPDPGAQMQVVCNLEAVVTDVVPAGSTAPDPGGFVAFSLSQQPAAGTLQVQWITARETSNTSGGKLTMGKPYPAGGGAGTITVPLYETADPVGTPGAPLPPDAPAPRYRFRVDFLAKNPAPTGQPLEYVVLRSVGDFATAAAAANAMDAAFAAGPIPAGTQVGDVLTLAGHQMRVAQAGDTYGRPTNVAADFPQLKTVIYPSAPIPGFGSA